jgi:hypothetical protein
MLGSTPGARSGDGGAGAAAASPGGAASAPPFPGPRPLRPAAGRSCPRPRGHAAAGQCAPQHLAATELFLVERDLSSSGAQLAALDRRAAAAAVVVVVIGVFEGNGGDLRIGLPMQSLHDGRTLRHTPLRLSVFVEAPRAGIESVMAAHQR